MLLWLHTYSTLFFISYTIRSTSSAESNSDSKMALDMALELAVSGIDVPNKGDAVPIVGFVGCGCSQTRIQREREREGESEIQDIA